MNVVDIGNTCFSDVSYSSFGAGSGIACPRSGALVGDGCDMLNANNYCNLNVVGTLIVGSGDLRIAVQTAPADVSGQYTDPTSGLAAFPGAFLSGGILILNSGITGVSGCGFFGPFVSGQALNSGFCVFQAFQRPQQYARAIVLSGGQFTGPLQVSFVSQLKTAGSGGGFTFSPTSGTVNV